MHPAERTLAEAGRAAVAEHLRDLAFALAQAREASEEKSVHRARVATRRLRTVLDVLQVVLGRSVKKPRRQLRALARVLGGVRELDVLIASQKAANVDDRDARRARVSVRAGLGLRIDSRRTRRLLARLARIARTPRDDSAGPGEPPILVGDFAGSWLLRQCEAVQAYGRDLAVATPATLHRLRIRVKRFRYSLELFADALDPAGTAPILATLVRAQDHLGALRDAEVLCARRPSGSGKRGLAALEATTPQVLQELLSRPFRRALIALVTEF